jgi:hypothetical protein
MPQTLCLADFVDLSGNSQSRRRHFGQEVTNTWRGKVQPGQGEDLQERAEKAEKNWPRMNTDQADARGFCFTGERGGNREKKFKPRKNTDETRNWEH